MDATNPWYSWLNNVPLDGISGLVEALRARGSIPASQTNGHAHPAPIKGEIPIICTPADQLYARNAERFVDVFKLLPEFEKLAFTDHGNLIIKGPKGEGKSLSVRHHAWRSKTPLVVVECSENTKDLHLLGRYVLVGQETRFVLSGITKAIHVANQIGACILLLEEFNALTPQSQKLLNGVLQERAVEVDSLGRSFYLENGAKLWVTGTMNPSVYGGTYDLNEDLKSRVGEIEIDYPPFELEKQIVKSQVNTTSIPEQIVDLCIRFAHETRQQATGYALSSRDLVRTLHTINSNGLPAALQMLACKFEGEERKTAITRMHSHFQGVQIKNSWGAVR